VRFPLVLFAVSLGSVASADRLIDIPTARKIPYEDYRYEFRAQPFAGGAFEQYLGVGVGKSFELDLRGIEQQGEKQIGTFDFAYDFIAAIPGVSPGISFGVQDGQNQTQDGRRFYGVTTFREPMQVINESVKADISLGFQVGKLTSPFVGVELPFSRLVYLVAEHSGYRLSAGLELRPAPNLVLRYVDRGNQMLVSLSVSSRF